MYVSIRTARMSAQRRTHSQSASESWNAVHGIFLVASPGRRMVVIGPNLRSAVLMKTLIVCGQTVRTYQVEQTCPYSPRGADMPGSTYRESFPTGCWCGEE